MTTETGSSLVEFEGFENPVQARIQEIDVSSTSSIPNDECDQAGNKTNTTSHKSKMRSESKNQ